MSASEARAERLASGPVCPKCGCLGRGKTPPKPSQAELRARLEEETAEEPRAFANQPPIKEVLERTGVEPPSQEAQDRARDYWEVFGRE